MNAETSNPAENYLRLERSIQGLSMYDLSRKGKDLTRKGQAAIQGHVRTLLGLLPENVTAIRLPQSITNEEVVVYRKPQDNKSEDTRGVWELWQVDCYATEQADTVLGAKRARAFFPPEEEAERRDLAMPNDYSVWPRNISPSVSAEE